MPKAEKKDDKPKGPKFKDPPDKLMALFAAVRNKYHKTLEEARIRVVLVNDWQSVNGEQVNMKVAKASSLNQCLYHQDGYVFVSEPFWHETMKPTTNRDERRQAEKLVKVNFDHELCHFTYDEGKLKVQPAPHEFPAVIKHWGVDAPGVATNPLVMAVREHLQLALDLEEDDEGVTRLPQAAK